MSGVTEVSPKYLAEAASNAVPVGYKQTEVGVIPEDWQVIVFGEVLSIRHGKSQKQIESESGLYPILATGGQIGWGNSYLWDKPSVLIGRKGTINKPRYCDEPFWTVDTLFYSEIYNQADAKFTYYKFCMIDWMQYNEASGVPSLNSSTIENVAVAYPQKKEQTAIANALSDVDALISELEKLIAKKQAIKTATMQQLLTGRTRLPQFALREDGTPKGTKPSELGEIPEDWEVGFVGDVCDMLTGFPFPSSKYSDSGVRLLRGSNVKRSCTDWSEEITQYWPELTSSIAQYELKIGDIVISMDGSLVGRSFAQLRESDLPAVLLQRVARLRSEAVSQSYLKEWVCSKFFTEHCDSVKTVTAIPHISPQDIRSFKLLLPPSKEEQTAIATILSDMDAEIQALEQRLGKTRQIKQGMMQELLTGKTRLVQPLNKESQHG
ncbi:restriction endonuclease subunit S [Jinshanibacter sp. LJY008]|uniref:Restriction endonuclease subunit S n=1 Tax=Limnobaculum eriocheiris TaxID=2897391 RepID=A0A9X1SJU9_9GAMM|nr:restriction endonuclease subunit S [Limnobaculum eriocheiris]MCD1125883.1 restriction endonuclease subunit S [Limnobaculum eriocheiris]